MKKTFTINISGIIFHIDDDAFAKLNAYLASIKKHFQNFEGKDEIIADIESRIAEILQSKLTETKQVIALKDVEEVIKRMGEPSEFMEDEDEEDHEAYKNTGYKRLYRDPEEKWIGGVASGIAAYFNIEPVWVRLIFVLSIFSTLGPFIYLILWIALPEALSTAEKLEMRGERVTISNIEKSMKKEFENLKERFNDLGEQAKKSYERSSPYAKNIFENILDAFMRILRFFGQAFLVLIGIILLLIGFSITIGFFGRAFGSGGILINDHVIVMLPIAELSDLLLSASGNAGLFKVGLSLLLGIPVLMLIYHGIRLIIRFDRIKGLGSTVFALWCIGLVFTLVFSYRVYQNLKYEVTDSERLQIEQPTSNILNLNLKEINGEDQHDYEDFIEIDDVEIAFTENAYYINQAKLEILKSHSGKFELIRHASARGKSGSNAKQKAEMITYYFEQQNNIFNFDQFYGFSRDVPWSDQKLELEFRVPIGTILKLDHNIQEIMIRKYGRGYNNYWGDNIYIMTEDGLEAIEDEEMIKENKSLPLNKNDKQISKLNKKSTLLSNIIKYHLF